MRFGLVTAELPGGGGHACAGEGVCVACARVHVRACVHRNKRPCHLGPRLLPTNAAVVAGNLYTGDPTATPVHHGDKWPAVTPPDTAGSGGEGGGSRRGRCSGAPAQQAAGMCALRGTRRRRACVYVRACCIQATHARACLQVPAPRSPRARSSQLWPQPAPVRALQRCSSPPCAPPARPCQTLCCPPHWTALATRCARACARVWAHAWV